jgi:hypothetical protein
MSPDVSGIATNGNNQRVLLGVVNEVNVIPKPSSASIWLLYN